MLKKRGEIFPVKLILTAIVILFAVPFYSNAQEAQTISKIKPLGIVSDYAHVINADDALRITAIGEEVKTKSGAEIAVLTVDSLPQESSLEEFGLAIGTNWGVGKKAEDNGVLIILVVTERRVRIEVGYGLEGAITDSRSGAILNSYIIPYVKTDDFSSGLREGFKAIAVVVAKEYNFSLAGLESSEFNNFAANIKKQEESSSLLSIIIYIFLIVLVFAGGGKSFLPFLLLSSIGGSGRGGFGSGFGYGSGRGSSFSGGFSGFSGGSFGGGGASRRF
jgi:uncharacterized protein